MHFIIPNVNSTTGGYGYSLERFRDAELEKDVDVLIFGSSHAYRGFDPRVLEENGKNVFNFGSSAQTPINSYYLLEQYGASMKPKVVVMDVFWDGLASPPAEAVESSIDICSNKELNKLDLEMMIGQHNVLLTNTFMFHAIRNKLKPIANAVQENIENDQYISGGYVERTFEGSIEKDLIGMKPEKKEYNSQQLDYILKMKQYCDENQIRFVLTRVPITAEVIVATPNTKELKEQMVDFCSSNSIEFIDYCNLSEFEAIGLDSYHDFYDPTHMCKTGVEKFNRYLLTNDELGLFK